jgi:NACHT domain
LISGSPGAGKSAIASSLVTNLTLQRRLGLYFFFKRGDANLGNPASFWRTVAHNLARFHPAIKSSLVDFLSLPGFRDNDIFLHFKAMVDDVLTKNCRMLSARPPVIIIDALDECGWDHSHSVQRRVLLDTLTSWSRLPRQFKLIVTSRNERLPNLFNDPQHCFHITLETGDFTGIETHNDIRTFFRQRLVNIAPSVGFPLSWPGEPVIEQLTQRAAGLFIWAQTAISFMEEEWCQDPVVKLKLIIAGNLGVMNDNVDMLYQQILDFSFKNADNATLGLLRAVVGTIIVAQVPLHRDDLKYFVTQEDNVAEWRLNTILHRLSSVIHVDPLRIRHLSFAEFMTDADRCRDQRFYIDKGKLHQTMVDSCMLIMKENLRFNICRLESSYLRNSEVSDLAERIATFIPSPLSYSCRFWVAHLSDAIIYVNEKDIMKEINEFLHVNFLHWLEIISLIREVSQLKATLTALTSLIEVSAACSKAIHHIITKNCRLTGLMHTALPE